MSIFLKMPKSKSSYKGQSTSSETSTRPKQIKLTSLFCVRETDNDTTTSSSEQNNNSSRTSSSTSFTTPIVPPAPELEIEPQDERLEPEPSLTSTSSDQTVRSQPNQPDNYTFPQRVFKKSDLSNGNDDGDPPDRPDDHADASTKKKERKYRFQASWFQKWRWLHYLESNDAVLCFYCSKADQMNLACESKGESAFVTDGFYNWKHATESKKGFNKHEHSKYHALAVQMVTIPNTCEDVGELLSQTHKVEKELNRTILMALLTTARYLARQGIAYRGHKEIDSNFLQLLKLRCDDITGMDSWLERKRKYISPQIQNEFLETMALNVLRQVVADVRTSPFYSILADETTDASNRQQLVVCLRWIDDKLHPQEDFVGLYGIERADAKMISSLIRDVLVRSQMTLAKCRGQCYDGCNTMSGQKNGVAANIKRDEPRALYTHCYGHALNLACGDAIKNSKIMKEALDTANEVTKLVKASPKRESEFRHIKDDHTQASEMKTPNVRLLCPTRWTVRHKSLDSILANYKSLLNLWDWAQATNDNTETKAKIQGVECQMKKFDFFFGVSLATIVLSHAESLSETLQKRSLSACEAKCLATMTTTALSSTRTDDAWKLFWAKTCKLAKTIEEVGEPVLPRRRQAPKRLEECLGGTAAAEFPDTVDDHFRRIYFEVIDLATTSITERFTQPDYEIYSKCENLLLAASKGEEYDAMLHSVCDFFGDDFSRTTQSTQLGIFKCAYDGDSETIHDIFKYFQQLGRGQRQLMGEVVKVVQLLMVAPATNATSERSFSTLRRIKSYLRSTMNQSRLNHLMICDIYNERLDMLDMKAISNEFVHSSESRSEVFGLYKL